MTTEPSGVMTMPAAARPFSWRRAVLAFGLTLAAIVAFVAAFAAAYATLHTGRVLSGVSVAGVPVAGLDRSGAEAALRSELPSVSSGALTVHVGETSQTISYAEIGRDYDIGRMLDEAFGVGRAGTPVQQAGEQLRTLVNGVSVPVSVTYDAQRLAARIRAIASAAEVAPTDATISRPDGDYVVTPAVTGAHVDSEALLAQALNALATSSGEDTSISIEPTAVAPAVSTGAAQAAVDRANSVAAEPLSVTVAGRTLTIDPDTIKGWTHLDPAGTGAWNLTIEHGPVVQWVSLLKDDVDIKPTNASYTFEGRRPVVTPEAPGSSLDADAATAAIYDALTARTTAQGSSSVALSMATVAPTFTRDQAQALVGRVKRLSSWTTHYVSSSLNGFGQNIRRPTRLINGTVIQPGETFDFLDVAGPITVRNGYTSGAAIIHGETRLDGVLGGGLCSTSTTLFNAAARAGFEIGARRNHAYYISRYPVGLDATIWVSGNHGQTMSFTNDSAYPIMIRGAASNSAVTFSIYGVPDGRHVHIAHAKVTNRQPAWTQLVYTKNTSIVAPGGRKTTEFEFDGFDASVERVVTDASGNVIHDDIFHSSYRRVLGRIYIGWQPGDPPPGTVRNVGRPAS